MNNKVIQKTVLVLSVYLLICASTYAREFRVANLQQITTALQSVQAGDTILMLSGTWTNSKVVFSAKGTADKPVFLRAEVPGKVVLTGTSTLRIAGNYLVVEGLYFKDGYSDNGDVIEFRNGSSLLSSYCRLTDCAVVNYNPSAKDKDYKWISLYGANNRVDHCYIRDKNHSGTTLVVWLSDKPNYHQIDHNYFARRQVLGFNGGETIRVGTSDWSMFNSYTTVEYNYFEECDGETEIISSKSCENIYRYNTFYKCSGTLTLRHGNRCTVEGNYFFGKNKKDTGGIRIIGEDHKVYNNYLTELTGSGYRSAISMVNGIPNSKPDRYFQVKNAQVVFNTLVNNKYSINIGTEPDTEKTLPPLNCTIANNIIKGSQAPLVKFEAVPLNLSWKGNILYGAATGVADNSGIIIKDPGLTISSDTLWRLSSSSPAIGSAEGTYSFVTEDFDGQLRDAAKDAGCDQYSDKPAPRRPVSSKDTGPAWISIITGQVSAVEIKKLNLPAGYVLEQNFPNPFNPETVISYSLRKRSSVKLQVFDITGSLIETLADEIKEKGNYKATWKPSPEISSGIYYYRLSTEEFVSVKKMNYIK